MIDRDAAMSSSLSKRRRIVIWRAAHGQAQGRARGGGGVRERIGWELGVMGEGVGSGCFGHILRIDSRFLKLPLDLIQYCMIQYCII